MWKVFFTLEIFTFSSGLFGYLEKRLYKNAEFNIKIYVVTDWTANTIYLLSKSQEVKAIKQQNLVS